MNNNYYIEKLNKLWEKYKIIQNLYDANIFNIQYDKETNKCYIIENCDQWFNMELNIESIDEIIKYFTEIKNILYKINEMEK